MAVGWYEVAAWIASYLFFCAIALDPTRTAVVCVGHPAYGLSVKGPPTVDPRFRFFGAGGLFWTALLMAAVNLNPQYCSFHPASLWSYQSGFAILTIALSGKILFGPALHVTKTIRLVGGAKKFTQPISFRIYDALRIWPANVATKFFWKLTFVSFMTGVVWLFGMKGSPGDVVPLPLALAWSLACLARVGSFIFYKKPAYTFQAILYAATVIVGAIMLQTSESMLQGCGASSGKVPSYESLLGGLFGLPLVEVIAALFSAIF